MKHSFFILFVLGFLGDFFAQEIIFDWNKLLGNTGNTKGLSLACDSAGFIYASGTFQGEININGTILNSAGERDGYLFKLDSLGNLIWSKHFSSNKNVNIYSLTINNDNDLLLLGDYKVEVNFDTTITTNNIDTIYSSNLFIAKYNPNGDLIWAKNTGGISFEGNSMSVDVNNDILITGKSIDISLFDTTIPINTLDSTLNTYPGGTYWAYYHPEMAFIAKYSTDGNMIWIKETGGDPQHIISDHSGNISITGNFIGETYFDGMLAPQTGFETTYLVQYSPAGNLNWIKTSGGSANWNTGYGLEVDSNNNIYQCGQILGNDIEFDGNIILPFGGTDAFLAKYDVHGNLIWYKIIGTPTTMNGEGNFNSGNSLKIDNNGDILLLGYFVDTLTFGTSTLESNGAFDIMLLKYNPNGDVISSSQYTDYGWVEGLDIDVDINNNIYTTGLTYLDNWNSSFPNYAFIGKIDEAIPTSPLGVMENSSLSNVIVYPNPTQGKLHIEFSDIPSNKKIEIFSIEGMKINEFSTLESNISLEIKEKGIYLILVNIDDERIIKKVIIE
jgi:hypothetical protein